MAENREYKSDVFSMLMEDKANALQVYNALNGSSYDDPEMVELVNLENIISLSIRNDAAFIVGASINIYEHQSSYNPNMPLRSLIYFATIMNKRLKKRDILDSRPVKLPTPHFAVFYNGTNKRPEKEILRLSDLYEKSADTFELELTCTVYNINPGVDKEILEKCSILNEYTQFVEAVRKNESEGIDNPIEKAIEYCISNHILEKFLRERGKEVYNAMTLDMTFERRQEIWQEEKEELIRSAEAANKRAEAAEKEISEAHKRIAELEELLASKQ